MLNEYACAGVVKPGQRRRSLFPNIC